MTNVVHHAHVDQPTGDVRVRPSFTAAEVAVIVEDDGGAMRPRADAPALALPLMATVATRDVTSRDTQFCAWFSRGS